MSRILCSACSTWRVKLTGTEELDLAVVRLSLYTTHWLSDSTVGSGGLLVNVFTPSVSGQVTGFTALLWLLLVLVAGDL